MSLSSLPATKHADAQQRLFETPLGGHAYARNVLGDFVEHLTALLFRGRRMRTDSRCEYCPDVEKGDLYLECKSAGLTRQTFVYEGRIEKDRAFSRDRRLAYVIWHHRAYTKNAETVEDLRALFLKKLRSIYIVPFAHIDMLVSGIQPERLNTKYGGTDRKTYGRGYRLNLRDLDDFRIDVRVEKLLFL